MSSTSSSAAADNDGVESVVVAYHYPCPDGAFGALAAHLALAARGAAVRVRWAPLQVFRPEAERVATLAASLAPRDTLYLIDITGGPAFIAACCARARRVVVLDHHKTGAEDLAQPALAALANLEPHFDMARSGATMARDHFGVAALLGGSADAARVLRLFALIEDNDLYRHALPGSKEFAAGFHALGLELDASARGGALFAELLALDPDAVTARGREALVEQERIVDEELAGAFAVDIAAPGAAPGAAPLLSCLAVLTKHPDLRSQQGNKLAAMSVRMRARRACAPVVHASAPRTPSQAPASSLLAPSPPPSPRAPAARRPRRASPRREPSCTRRRASAPKLGR
jgi:hypothetical protein